MQKITPFLWLDANLQEAIDYYTSIFKNSKVTSLQKTPDGSLMTATFEIEGQPFTLLSGGTHFTFNESISFMIRCETQQEVDHYWNSLTANGGQESMCGWLKDKYGLSWQITPTVLLDLMAAGGEGGQRVMQAMMQMRKIDITTIEEAYNG